MFQLFEQAAKYIDEHAIQLIDLKFYKWIHSKFEAECYQVRNRPHP